MSEWETSSEDDLLRQENDRFRRRLVELENIITEIPTLVRRYEAAIEALQTETRELRHTIKQIHQEYRLEAVERTRKKNRSK